MLAAILVQMKAIVLNRPYSSIKTAPAETQSNQVRRVEDCRTADYLMNPRGGWRFFLPFLGAEQSLAEVSRLVGAPLNQVHYHVKLMLKLHLISLVRTQPRAGRAIHYYRAVSDAWYVPATKTSAESFEQVVLQNEQLWSQWLTSGLIKSWWQTHQDWGWFFGYQTEHGLRFGEQPDPQIDDTDHALLTLNEWVLVEMTPSQAKDLQDDLRALLNRHLQKTRATGLSLESKKHLIHLALTSVQNED